MLIAFSVENYRSFKERVTLSMVAADLHSKPPELDQTNVFTPRAGVQLLTSAAIYGANASGKSNLIDALRFMRSFVLNSSRETRLHEPVHVTPFRLRSDMEHQPSWFEIVFLDQGNLFRYGFSVSQDRVESEWLFTTGTKKESYLFKRTPAAIQVNRRSFREGLGLEERTRPNALFLSVVAQWNGAQAGHILEWFERLVINTGVEDRAVQRGLSARYGVETLAPEVIAFVRNLDVGIEDIQVEQDPDREITVRIERENTPRLILDAAGRIQTIHPKYNSDGSLVAHERFDLFSDESQGTQRLFVLAEPILAALRNGTVLVIDELDARLHPILTCAIIRLFNTPETNPTHAQLIFTTHDTNLLSSGLFRRDQIWFVEKSRRGESTLYSLAEYKARNDAAYEKNYIAGRYGAIPYLGSLTAAIGVDDAEHTAIATEVGYSTGVARDHGDLSATPGGDED